MLWVQEARKQLTLKHPTLDASAIATRLGDMWKHLPDQAKAPYIKPAKRLSKVHGDKGNGSRRGRTPTSTCRCKYTAHQVRSIAVQCNLGKSSAVEPCSDCTMASHNSCTSTGKFCNDYITLQAIFLNYNYFLNYLGILIAFAFNHTSCYLL